MIASNGSRGRGGIETAFARFTGPALVVAVESGQLNAFIAEFEAGL